MEQLTIKILKREAAKFSKIESKHEEPSIFGSTGMKNTQSQTKKEFGDFQTPLELAGIMIDIVKSRNLSPDIIVEPTCGVGNILVSAHKQFSKANGLGIEINPVYCNKINTVANSTQKITVINADFFKSEDIIKSFVMEDRVSLFIGNPPWVTNSEISGLNGTNLPKKSNIKNLRGIEAITGKSNFDIGEYIILRLVQLFHTQKAAFAFLCKTIVARNILKYCWSLSIPYKEAALYPIDSQKYFSAAVDACFFFVDFTGKKHLSECSVYDNIETQKYIRKHGFYHNRIIVDIDKFKSHNYMGKCSYIWRNGIKHDCSKVMELDIEDGTLKNGYGEYVDVEDGLLYPLLKGSDIARGNLFAKKMIIIPQTRVGEDTRYIKTKYPKTWDYLYSYSNDFAIRKSSIYRNKPPFSIFSIGEYSFQPIKIAISGFYKQLSFRLLLPQEGKCVMVDDTCNFIPCKTESEAEIIYSLLTSHESIEFFNSIVFWDSKRPITTEVLNSLDLQKIAGKHCANLHYHTLSKYNKSVIKQVPELGVFA